MAWAWIALDEAQTHTSTVGGWSGHYMPLGNIFFYLYQIFQQFIKYRNVFIDFETNDSTFKK